MRDEGRQMNGTNPGTTRLADEWHKQQKIMIFNMRFTCHPLFFTDIAPCQFAALAPHYSLAMLADQRIPLHGTISSDAMPACILCLHLLPYTRGCWS